MSAAFDAAPSPGAEPGNQPPGFPAETFRANLYLHHADGRIEWYALLPSSFQGGRALIIGRAPNCAVWVDDHGISSRHARIFAHGAALYLEDLGSTNGTFLGDAPVRRVVLAHGAVITMGHTELRFLYSHRHSPVRLECLVRRGPLAGARHLSDAASTTLGAHGCDIDLPGPGVAPRHLRIDAYAPDRVYAVPLDDRRPARLDGAPLTGITALPPGGDLQIGAHHLAVRAVVVTPRGSTVDGAEIATPRVDAALVEARLQGRDPRAYTQRTIMDLSPLGAMVAKVLAGEAPAPPSAVRPSARPQPRKTALVDARSMRLELQRRTGPIERVAPPAARASGWLIAALLIVVVVIVVGLVPIRRTVTLHGHLEAVEPLTIEAPLRGRLVRHFVTAGDLVPADAPLVQIADRAIDDEVERLSTRIGALEVHARAARIKRRDVDRAEAALADATAAVDALVRAAGPFEDIRTARVRLAEATGRRDATLARRADRRAGPRPADATAELARLVQRRQALTHRLRVTLAAPLRGRVASLSADPPGAPIDPGRPLLTLVPADALLARFDPSPRLIATDRTARLTIGAHRLDAALAPAGDHLVARVPTADPTLTVGAPVVAELDAPPASTLSWLWSALTR